MLDHPIQFMHILCWHKYVVGIKTGIKAQIRGKVITTDIGVMLMY
tara:strand:+ start:245 stop:379 length:135 start_codon:yes stop_codon:yes gene_type:complete